MAHPGGRPTKLTVELIDKITNAIRGGAYVETACALNGIAKDTYYNWLKKAAKSPKKTIFKQFSDAIEEALAQSEMRALLIVDKAAQAGSLKAATWYLERKFPTRWGRREQLAIEHSGPNGGPIRTSELSPEEKALELKRLSNLLKLSEDE